MTIRITRPSVTAAAVAAALAAACLGATVAAPGAHASLSDAPCSTSVPLAEQNLYANVGKGSALVGKLYVFREGKQLCAVTTTAGTAVYGKAKAITVVLTSGGATEFDTGPYSFYAGRIRLPDKGGCFTAYGAVTLKSGQSAEVNVDCSTFRGRATPR